MFGPSSRAALLAVAGAVLIVAAPLAAQAPEAATAPAGEIGQPELERFAKAYLEIMQIGEQTEEALTGVQDPERAQAIQMQAQEQMAEVLEQQQLDPDRYRAIGVTLNEDEALRERFITIIQVLQAGGGGG